MLKWWRRFRRVWDLVKNGDVLYEIQYPERTVVKSRRKMLRSIPMGRELFDSPLVIEAGSSVVVYVTR